MREEVLRMEHVTYKEQGVIQLKNFSISICAGEILGLLPVNRYGVSTLVRLLRQNLPLHYGYVYYREKLINEWRHSDYEMNRVGVIQNKSCLTEGLTVADNIFVLRAGFKKHFIQPKVLKQQLASFLEDIEIDIDADARIEELSTFERFVVELLKAVVAGNYLIILDDISSFMSDVEIRKLHKIIRHYAGYGFSFLYIVHHFEEARQICDRTALMQNGHIVKYCQSSEYIPDSCMYQWTEDFNRFVSEQIAGRMEPVRKMSTAFRVEGLCYKDEKELNFEVAQGECLVLQDLNNRLLPDFLKILMGTYEAQQGRMWIGEEEFIPGPDRRIAIIQEVPTESMLFPNMTYLDNLCFALDHRFPDVWHKRSIKKSLREEYADLLGEHVFDSRVEDLSQKEQYDLIYTRILLQNPKVVFCAQPFKRAGVSVRIHVWDLLERFLNKGIAVVILAVNLADSLALADRLIRVGKGQQMQEYARKDFKNLPIDAPWLYLYHEQDAEESDPL